MNLIGEFTTRLDWEMAPFLNWTPNHWAISLWSFFFILTNAAKAVCAWLSVLLWSVEQR
jgi:hypothetical protein